MARKRKSGGGRKHGASCTGQLIRDAIGIALDLLFIDSSPVIRGKVARWAAALADPSMQSLFEIKSDCVGFQLMAPQNVSAERLDNIGKNLRQRLNGTSSNASLTVEQREFVSEAAEVVYAILASRSLFVSQQFVTVLAGWPPAVVQHLREFALWLNAQNPEYLSPWAALSDPILQIFTRRKV